MEKLLTLEQFKIALPKQISFVVAPSGFEQKKRFEVSKNVQIIDGNCVKEIQYTPILKYISNQLLGVSRYEVEYDFQELQIISCEEGTD